MLPKNKKLPNRPSLKLQGGGPNGGPNTSGMPGSGPRPTHPNPPHGYHPAQHGGLGVDGKKGDKKHKKKGKHYGAVGPYPGVPNHLLNQLVNGLLGQEMRDLRHQRQQVRRTYQRGLGDLNHVFGETGDYLNFLQGQNQQQYSQTGQNIDAANQALQGQLGGIYGGAQGGANAELARLGMGDSVNMGGISADQANAQGMAAITGQNASSTLDLASNNTAQMAGLLQGMNQGSYQQAVGQNLNARNDAMNKIMDAIVDTKKSRKDVWLQLAQQLQQTGWDQFLQLQQLKMQKKQLRGHKKH